jgi:hypothetical protein
MATCQTKTAPPFQGARQLDRGVITSAEWKAIAGAPGQKRVGARKNKPAERLEMQLSGPGLAGDLLLGGRSGNFQDCAQG